MKQRRLPETLSDFTKQSLLHSDRNYDRDAITIKIDWVPKTARERQFPTTSSFFEFSHNSAALCKLYHRETLTVAGDIPKWFNARYNVEETFSWRYVHIVRGFDHCVRLRTKQELLNNKVQRIVKNDLCMRNVLVKMLPQTVWAKLTRFLHFPCVRAVHTLSWCMRHDMPHVIHHGL